MSEPVALVHEKLTIDQIIPYWRNPRRVSSEAVQAVAESIRQYGYQQPIVVDAEHVIIAGHTRYAALRRLNVTETEVIVVNNLSPRQVKQLRIIDNKTSEYSMWDFDKLMVEFEDLDREVLGQFFPELGEEDRESVVRAEFNAEVFDESEVDDSQNEMVEFVCPGCFYSWHTRVTKADIVSGTIRGVKE